MSKLETNFCNALWEQLGDTIARIVYESQEENTEKGAIIYKKNGKLIMGPVLTGTETEIKGLTAQKELGNPIGSFHTHPISFFPSPEEEHFLSLAEKEERKKETVFSSPDLTGVFLANVDALCVIGDGFALHCLTGIQQARENLKAATLLDILRERTEKNQKIFLEDIKKLGLDQCKRDITKTVYKIAREAKRKSEHIR